MLPSLRLDGLVGGDDQQHQIQAGCSREHVADETLVSRDIDKAQADAVLFEECEAEVNGDAAALFLFQSVGVCTGQSFD